MESGHLVGLRPALGTFGRGDWALRTWPVCTLETVISLPPPICFADWNGRSTNWGISQPTAPPWPGVCSMWSWTSVGSSPRNHLAFITMLPWILAGQISNTSNIANISFLWNHTGKAQPETWTSSSTFQSNSCKANKAVTWHSMNFLQDSHQPTRAPTEKEWN